MSNNYDSETRTPRTVLTPEERQRQEMERTIQNAIREANRRYQEQRRELERQHQRDAQELQRQIEQLSGAHRAFMEQHYQQLESLRREHQRRLDEAIEQAEARRQEDRLQLEGEIMDLQEQTEEAIINLRTETLEAIDDVIDSVEQLREETREELAKQQKQITDLATEVHEDKARALETMRVLTEYCKEQQSIIVGKNPEKYAPGQLARIEARLKGIESLPPTSACAVLSMVFNDLLTLDTDIEIAKLEYEKKHLLVIKAAEDVFQRMKESQDSIPVTDGCNNPLQDEDGNVITIKLDDWCDGAYSRLMQKLKDLISEVEEGLNNPTYTTAKLDAALQEIFEINRQQLKLTLDCIEKVKASQVRKELACAVIKHLKGQCFFKVKEQGFEGNDPRNAYFIKFYDEHSEIVVVINPDESSQTNHVIIKTVFTEMSEIDVDQQNEDINEVLREAGVDTERGVCHGDNPEVDEGWRVIYDMDVVSSPIPAEIKKKARLKDTRAKQNEESSNS